MFEYELDPVAEPSYACECTVPQSYAITSFICFKGH
jgi:hypothetical protein